MNFTERDAAILDSILEAGCITVDTKWSEDDGCEITTIKIVSETKQLQPLIDFINEY